MADFSPELKAYLKRNNKEILIQHNPARDDWKCSLSTNEKTGFDSKAHITSSSFEGMTNELNERFSEFQKQLLIQQETEKLGKKSKTDTLQSIREIEATSVKGGLYNVPDKLLIDAMLTVLALPNSDLKNRGVIALLNSPLLGKCGFHYKKFGKDALSVAASYGDALIAEKIGESLNRGHTERKTRSDAYDRYSWDDVEMKIPHLMELVGEVLATGNTPQALLKGFMTPEGYAKKNPSRFAALGKYFIENGSPAVIRALDAVGIKYPSALQWAISGQKTERKPWLIPLVAELNPSLNPQAAIETALKLAYLPAVCDLEELGANSKKALIDIVNSTKDDKFKRRCVRLLKELEEGKALKLIAETPTMDTEALDLE